MLLKFALRTNNAKSVPELTDEVLILILLDAATAPSSFSRQDPSSDEMVAAAIDVFTAGYMHT